MAGGALRRNRVVSAVALAVALCLLVGTAPAVLATSGAPTISTIRILKRTATGGHRLRIVGTNLDVVTKLRFGAAGRYTYARVRPEHRVASALTTVLRPVAPAGADLRRVAAVSPSGTSAPVGVPPLITAVRVLRETATGGLRLEVDGTNLRSAKLVRYGRPGVEVLLTSTMRKPTGSDVQIRPIAPPGVDIAKVAVVNAAGTSARLAAQALPPPPPPRPTIADAAWVGRNSDNSYEIVLRGTGFLAAKTVVYGGETSRLAYELQDTDRRPAGSDIEIRAMAPPGADLSRIRIVSPNGESNVVALANLPPEMPVLTSATFKGYGNYYAAQVRLEGQHLATATQVAFGTGYNRRTYAVTAADRSAGAVTATAPVGADLTQVQVSTEGGHSNIVSLPNLPVVEEARLIQKLDTVRMWVIGERMAQAFKGTFGLENAYQQTYNLEAYDHYDDGLLQVAPANTTSLDTYHIVMLSPSGPSNMVAMDNNVPAPTLGGVVPFDNGGVRSLRLHGSGFTDVISVNVGGVSAPTWNVVSASEMTAALPSGVSGDAAVKVQNVGGLSNAVTIRYPEVTSVVATTIDGLAHATINGAGLSGAHTVYFGFTAAAGAVDVISDAQIRVHVPDLPAGQRVLDVPVVVRTPVGDSRNHAAGCPGSPNCYTYPPPVPVVASVAPFQHDSGVAAVRVSGSNFAGVTSVTIGGTPTQWWPVSELVLIAAIPPGEGSREVRVTNGYGTSVGSSASTISSPSVSSVQETNRFAGDRRLLDVTGTNLGPATAVYIGGRQATGVQLLSDTTLRMQIPQLGSDITAMSVPVVVTTPYGTTTRAACPGAAACYRHRRAFVAIGDSFSSGEGAGSGYAAFEYTDIEGRWFDSWKRGGGADGSANLTDPITGNPTWYDNCHRSKYAYARRIEQQIHDRGYRLSFQACSGAVMKDVVERQQYLGLLPNQLMAVGQDTALVTLGIGGNDLGFAPALAYCVFKTDCHHAFTAGVHGGATEDIFSNNIRAMYPRLVNLYTRIRNKSGNAPVYVLGYPTIFSAAIKNTWCPDDAQDNTCSDGFTTEEKAYISAKQLEFTGIMAAAARRAGVHFVDLTHAYDGHEFSAPYFGADPSTSWFNPFILNRQVIDKEGTGKFAFHPTAAGHKANFDALVAAGVLQLRQNPAPDPSEQGPPSTDHWWTLDRMDVGELGQCALLWADCWPLVSDPDYHHPMITVGIDESAEPRGVAWGTTVRRDRATACVDGLWHGDKGNMAGHFYISGKHYVHCGPARDHNH